MSSTFSKNAEKALENALHLAESFGHTYVGSDHLLLALSEDKDSRLAEMLARCDIDSEKIKKAILDHSGCAVKTQLSTTDTTPKFRKHLIDAMKIAERYQDCSITTEHIFIAICEDKKSQAFKILRELGIDLRKIVLLRRKNK
jgi:ATP-dependent Clp protease ATP-binding subunit ClpC